MQIPSPHPFSRLQHLFTGAALHLVGVLGEIGPKGEASSHVEDFKAQGPADGTQKNRSKIGLGVSFLRTRPK